MGAIKESLTFDDVALVPQYSEVLPSDTITKTKLNKNLKLNIPLMSSAMDTVTESKMAIAISQAGGLGIIHRNLSPLAQAREVKKVKRAHATKDLDAYPMAAYHLLKMGDYKIGTLKGRLPFTSIMTFRGCPWKCIFCASDALDTTRILKRSIKSVVDEMQHIVEKYNVRHFMVLDDVLTLVRKRTVEFCNEIMILNCIIII